MSTTAPSGNRTGILKPLTLAAYPAVHQVVEQFRTVGPSGPLELSDPNDRTFVLAVIEAWAAQVGMETLPPGIGDLAGALREDRS
jgi:hypothetical protein